MFEIRLFGAVEVLQQGQALTGFRSQKTLTLLAFLIMENRLLARDYLAGLFWPDVTQSDALGHLRRSLHNLSRLLPDCLEVDRRTARFSAQAPATVDVHQFQQLVEQGSTSEMADAVELARAPFLEGMYFDDCPQLEAWITTEQERLRLALCRALEELIALHMASGQQSQALRYSRRLARLDPWREEVQRQLMLLLARSGRREEALAQYELCCRILREELDLQVSPATEKLYERIRHAPAQRHNLPPNPTPFVGREQELAQLQQLLADPRSRLVTIIGPGGAGKTRVAREVAARLANHFLEGVCYVDLTRLENPAQLPGALATALQIVLPEQADPRDYLLAFLRDREILLLLDNFEHLLEARLLLHDILQQAPAVRFLITSRRTVDLHEEQLYELEGLDAPPATAEPGTWQQYDAMRLLLDLTARYHGPLQPTNELEAAATICRLVQGSPLAIELAAATSRTLPLSHIARAIAQDLDILQTSLVNVPQRHRSLRAAIDHSWKLLDSAQQNAFASVALFRGGFSLAAADAVAGVGASQLQALVAHSLLRPVTTEDSSARWEMHELLRQYGRDRLKAHPERLFTTRDRHAAYYLALLEEEGKQLTGEEALAARATIARDSSNIRAAWRHACKERQWQRLAQSLDYLVRFYQHDGRMRECLPLLEEALKHAEEDAPQATSAVLALRLRAIHARLLALTGKPEQALAEALKALEQAEATGNVEVAVEARYALALVHFNKGQHVQSRTVAEEALVQAQQAQLATLEALLLNMMGRTFLRTDAQQAGDYFNLSLQRARALAIRRLEISSEINLSLVEGAAGDFAHAARRLRRAQTLAGHYGQHELQGTIALNLGTMSLQLGEYEEGLRQYEAALAAYRRSGDRARVGLGYHCQAVVAAEAGDFRDAQRSMRLAWELYRETGAQHRQLEIELWLGTTAQALGQYQQACDWLLNALSLAQEAHAETQRLEAHRRLIWLATEVGDYELAHSHLEQSAPLAHDRQALEQRFWLLLASSRLAHYEDHLPQAEAGAREALEMVRERSTRLVPEATIRLAHTLAQCEAWEEAQHWYQETEKLRSDRQQSHLAQEAQIGWARAAMALGDAAAPRQVLSQLLSDAGIVERLPVQGQQEPFLVCLFYYELLHHAQDERARSVLANTLDQLRKRTHSLDQPWRDSFLERVPVHRKLIRIAEKQGIRPTAS